ncbi:hypothetical protein PsorP6_012193 [Peronosclerospora sorghi]|uniref:Uncharacterized protein n=1 Tax=Peronosclerospora sorghi TaxID=230839 RepID=A0ACC0WL01_9STRA|nr:hypothetical protein PsorP6_012193 [Peronosclerospora sorghi]
MVNPSIVTEIYSNASDVDATKYNSNEPTQARRAYRLHFIGAEKLHCVWQDGTGAIDEEAVARVKIIPQLLLLSLQKGPHSGYLSVEIELG